MKENNLDKIFCGEKVITIVYLLNRSPTKVVHGMTPKQTWPSLTPSIAHIKVFGCVAYAHIPKG